MKNADSLQRFLFENTPIRGELVHLNHSFSEMLDQHKYSPLAQKLLGEALVLVSLLSAIVKFKGRMTLQFQSKGKLKLLLTQCNDDLQMRGLVQSAESMTDAELIENFREGVLVIIMDPEKSGKRYQGVVSWKGDSLAQSVEGYFQDSEQLLTRIWVAVGENQAAGLLLQKMPGETGSHDDASADEEAARQWEHLVHLTSTITPAELLGLENEVLLHRLYVEEDVRIFELQPTMFLCTCSVEKGENAILMLGKEEAEEELANHQVIDVTCEFCNRKFSFDRVDVTKIFYKGGSNPPSTEIH